MPLYKLIYLTAIFSKIHLPTHCCLWFCCHSDLQWVVEVPQQLMSLCIHYLHLLYPGTFAVFFPDVIYIISSLWRIAQASSESLFLGCLLFFNWILKLKALTRDLTISTYFLGNRGSSFSKAPWLCTSMQISCTAKWLQRRWRMWGLCCWTLWGLRWRHRWWLWYRGFHFLYFSFMVCSFDNSLSF